MKSTIAAFITAAAFVLLPVGANAQDQKTSVNSLGWMAGCWEVSENGRITTERWAKPTENLMIGTAQTVKNSKSVSFEFLRVVNNGHGLFYIAKPSDAKEETPFMISKLGEKEAIFENPKHDFPQRIIYRLEQKDALFARIEGTVNGQLKGMDIPMKRVRCE